MTRAALTAVTLAALLPAGAVLSGCECPQIHQDVFVATPDAMLAPLVEACRSGVPVAGQSCASSTSRNVPASSVRSRDVTTTSLLSMTK